MILKYDIKVMKWSGTGTRPAIIFANSSNWYGNLMLRLRGYKPHLTIFGTVFQKGITRITTEEI